MRVGVKDVEQPPRQRRPAEADVDAEHLGAVPQAIEVAGQEGDPSVDEPQSLPNAVAEHETGVEHGHLRFGARRQRAVDADEDEVVAGVAHIILRSA